MSSGMLEISVVPSAERGNEGFVGAEIDTGGGGGPGGAGPSPPGTPWLKLGSSKSSMEKVRSARSSYGGADCPGSPGAGGAPGGGPSPGPPRSIHGESSGGPGLAGAMVDMSSKSGIL